MDQKGGGEDEEDDEDEDEDAGMGSTNRCIQDEKDEKRYRVKYSVGIRWISNGCEKRVGDVNATYIPSIAIDFT